MAGGAARPVAGATDEDAGPVADDNAEGPVADVLISPHRSFRIDPNHRTLLVLIWKRPLEPLSIFQDPGIRRLVWYVIPAVHTMVADILLEGSATEAPHVDQLATTHQLASGAALREVNPAALLGRTSADLPRLPSG